MRALHGIALATVTLLLVPLAAVAQQPAKLPRIGLLVGGAPAFDPGRPHDHGALVTGLRDRGYIVDQNVSIEYRTAMGGSSSWWTWR